VRTTYLQQQAINARLVARIDAALALHTQTDASDGWDGYCLECSFVDAVEYPCPTVKALRGEK
jgi:hypothetical protein